MTVNESPTATDALVERLRAADVNPTAQRLAVAAVLFEAPAHFSAEQVLARLQGQQGVSVSKATVYNTLGLFARKGLVREVVVDPNHIVFDSNTAPHHHIYNVDDGSLIDVPLDAAALATLPERPEGTEVVGVDVIVRVRNACDNA